MTEEQIRLALKAKMTGREWRVLAAMAIGHREIYDIQVATSLKKFQVEAVLAQNGQTLREVININITTTLYEVVAQNGQTPPRRIISYLYQALNRPLTFTPAEVAAAKVVYARAYDFTGKNPQKAIDLVEDCIDAYGDESYDKFRLSSKPIFTLQKQVSAYLAHYPPRLPLEIYERQLARGGRYQYNHLTKQWRLKCPTSTFPSPTSPTTKPGSTSTI